MKNLRLALLGGSALLLAVSGMSVAACSDNSNSGFPTTKNDAATGDDDDDDDDDDSGATDAGSKKDATTSDGGASSDASTSTDTGTGSDATSAPGVKSADIYQCGAPSDCTGMNENCYITAYSDWDGGNFYNAKCGLTGANGGSLCKAASAAVTSDTEVCAKLDDGGYTGCPAGTTCQTVGIYGKNFGACLEENGYDAGCSPTRFIPYQGDPNYCFTAPVGATVDGGCTGNNPVCCDQTLLDGSFANSCVATTGACAQ